MASSACLDTENVFLVCKYKASSLNTADRLTLQRKVGHYET